MPRNLRPLALIKPPSSQAVAEVAQEVLGGAEHSESDLLESVCSGAGTGSAGAAGASVVAKNVGDEIGDVLSPELLVPLSSS